MFRFSIRDILWLTAVVAMAASLMTVQLQWARERASAQREMAIQRHEAAAGMARLQAQISALRSDNILQEHRHEVQLAAERNQHREELRKLKEAAAADIRRIHQAATLVLPAELEEPK